MGRQLRPRLHERFLSAFLRAAPDVECRVRESGAAAWSDYASSVLHVVQTELGLYCACNHPVNRRHLGERGEWLWDFSWYGTSGDVYYAPPLVVIEHENGHHDAHFMRDFWKILAANAPLRVMIGYTGQGAKLMERRIELIHKTATAWQFPAHATDIVLLRRYANDTWDILLRREGERLFTRERDDTWG